MTGSAGTAVDVLVPCFSKKGGGSGRREANKLPLSVTLGADLVQSRFLRGILKVWQALYFGHI